jgi:hypothetical protein
MSSGPSTACPVCECEEHPTAVDPEGGILCPKHGWERCEHEDPPNASATASRSKGPSWEQLVEAEPRLEELLDEALFMHTRPAVRRFVKTTGYSAMTSSPA